MAVLMPRPIATKYNLLGSIVVECEEMVIEIGFGGAKSSALSSGVSAAIDAQSPAPCSSSSEIGGGEELLRLYKDI